MLVVAVFAFGVSAVAAVLQSVTFLTHLEVATVMTETSMVEWVCLEQVPAHCLHFGVLHIHFLERISSKASSN